MFAFRAQGRFLSLEMTKAELRKIYSLKRSLLTEEELSDANTGLLDQLSYFDWSGVRYVHTFLPIIKNKEPDMWLFIEWIKASYPDIGIVISNSNPKDYSMNHFLLTDDIELAENSWGIVEPVVGEIITDKQIDVVLVPLLVVDTTGNRVGYGKGFYDRFLANCRSDTQKVGVSLFEPVEEITDLSPLDVPLDVVITPSSNMQFKH